MFETRHGFREGEEKAFRGRFPVIPKGRSLDVLTQAKVETLFPHISSHAREPNENRIPYDLMAGRFGEGVTETIGVKRMPAKDVLLKP